MSTSGATRAYLTARLLSELSAHGVRVMVLRNYEQLPSHVPGDVDLLIPDGVRPAAIDEAFGRAIADSGWSKLQTVRRPYMITYTFANLDDQRPILVVDCFLRLSWYCFDYARVGDVFARGVERQSAFVPAPEDEVFITLAHYLLWSGHVRERYRDGIATALNDPRVVKQLDVIFGIEHARQVRAAIVSGDWADLARRRFSHRLALMRRQISPSTVVGAIRVASAVFAHPDRQVPGVIVMLSSPAMLGHPSVASLIEAIRATHLFRRTESHNVGSSWRNLLMLPMIGIALRRSTCVLVYSAHTRHANRWVRAGFGVVDVRVADATATARFSFGECDFKEELTGNSEPLVARMSRAIVSKIE